MFVYKNALELFYCAEKCSVTLGMSQCVMMPPRWFDSFVHTKDFLMTCTNIVDNVSLSFIESGIPTRENHVSFAGQGCEQVTDALPKTLVTYA